MADADVHHNRNQLELGAGVLSSPGCLSTTSRGSAAAVVAAGVKRAASAMLASQQSEQDADRVKKILSLVKVLLTGAMRMTVCP
jgi:predicted Zn-dependent protease